MVRKHIVKKNKNIKRDNHEFKNFHCRECEEVCMINRVKLQLHKKIAKLLGVCERCQRGYDYSVKEIEHLDMTFKEKQKFFFGDDAIFCYKQ